MKGSVAAFCTENIVRRFLRNGKKKVKNSAIGYGKIKLSENGGGEGDI